MPDEQTEREVVLKRIDEMLQVLRNSPEERKAMVVKLGTPPSSTTLKLERLRHWRAESKARSTSKVL